MLIFVVCFFFFQFTKHHGTKKAYVQLWEWRHFRPILSTEQVKQKNKNKTKIKWRNMRNMADSLTYVYRKRESKKHQSKQISNNNNNNNNKKTWRQLTGFTKPESLSKTMFPDSDHWRLICCSKQTANTPRHTPTICWWYSGVTRVRRPKAH